MGTPPCCFVSARAAKAPRLELKRFDNCNIAEVSRVMLHELEHPCPPTTIPKSGLNVRVWHKADITRLSSDLRYWGVKQTLLTRDKARRIAANIAKLPSGRVFAHGHHSKPTGVNSGSDKHHRNSTFRVN
jgi:hypothetical protein